MHFPLKYRPTESDKRRKGRFYPSKNGRSNAKTCYFYAFPEGKGVILFYFCNPMKEKTAKKEKTDAQSATGTNVDSYFYGQVHRLGFLFCIKSEEWTETEQFIRKVQQDFPPLEVLVYFTQGKTEPKPAAPHLFVADKRDFNLFGKEKTELKQWLARHQFDLLVVFCKNEDKRCRKLGLSIKAKLRAGRTTHSAKPWTDLILGKADGALDNEGFYKALKSYFKQLNIKL